METGPETDIFEGFSIAVPQERLGVHDPMWHFVVYPYIGNCCIRAAVAFLFTLVRPPGLHCLQTQYILRGERQGLRPATRLIRTLQCGTRCSTPGTTLVTDS
jgi:hypothetical protein